MISNKGHVVFCCEHIYVYINDNKAVSHAHHEAWSFGLDVYHTESKHCHHYNYLNLLAQLIKCRQYMQYDYLSVILAKYSNM